MRPLALSARDRRALVIGVGGLAAVFGIGRGLPLLRDWSDVSRRSAAELRADLGRAEASLGMLSETLDSLEARGERFAGVAPLLVGVGTPAGAALTLASHVAGVAEQAGMHVGALRTGVDTTRARAYARVTVNGDLAGDVRGLMQLLGTLERGPQLLAVRELAVDQPEPSAPPDRPEVLQVHIVVEGVALRRSTEAGS